MAHSLFTFDLKMPNLTVPKPPAPKTKKKKQTKKKKKKKLPLTKLYTFLIFVLEALNSNLSRS